MTNAHCNASLSNSVGLSVAVRRRVKVCFISPLGYGLYTQERGYPFGGAEVQFFLLAQALASDPEFQVTVLTTVDRKPGKECHGPLTIIKRKGRGRAAPFPPTVGAWMKTLCGYATAFREMWILLRELEVDIYLHAGSGIEVGAYALICRLLRRRFVFVVASSADLTSPNAKVKGPLRWLYPMGVRLSDAVICRSREQQVWLRKRYGRDGVLIRTGHPCPATSSKAQPQKEESGILWVGRIHPLKQPNMFLDLAERLPNERCVMIAMPDNAHDGLWESVRRRAGSLANVTVYERIPWNEVNAHFEQAKLFVNTSAYEGFPNTFVQAAMHGTPILSWTVDPDDVLARYRIGICASGSFERLLAAAARVCTEKDLRAELAHRAVTYARDHHDLHQISGELKALMRSLVFDHEAQRLREE